MKQSDKAEFFRQQHHENGILLLPNVWDSLTARLVSSAGYRSLATASFSIAAANGYEDGEKIPFTKLVEAVAEIASAVSVPLSVDFERGYASDLTVLADNIKRLLDAGAIGINIEDRASDGKSLVALRDQCKKLEVIREAGIKYGVNLVINARTDAYILKAGDYMQDILARGKAYHDAGADCFYPVLMDNYADIERVLGEVALPVNLLLMKPIGDLKKLESMGVKRVSLGPGSVRYVLTKLQTMVRRLSTYDTSELFSEELMLNTEVMQLVKKQ